MSEIKVLSGFETRIEVEVQVREGARVGFRYKDLVEIRVGFWDGVKIWECDKVFVSRSGSDI